MWFLNSKRKAERAAREAMLTERVQKSQQELLKAATSTADAAHEVTIRLKQRLDDSLRQFEAAASIINDGLIVCDNTGVIHSYNPAAERMFGYRIDEVVKLGVHALLRVQQGQFKGPDGFFDAIEAGYHVDGMPTTGRAFPVEISMARLDRSDGSVPLILLLVHGVDENNMAAEATRYRSIFEAGCDGILIVQNERIVAVNPAAATLFGYAPYDLIDQHVGLIIQPSELEATDDNPIKALGMHGTGRPVSLMIQTAIFAWDENPATLVAVRALQLKAPQTIDLTCNACGGIVHHTH